MGGKRRRRPAAAARAQILDAAERQLAERGPDGIRLTELAAELGVSHPAILHHFGSRAGLVRAVVARTIQNLERELLRSFTPGMGEDEAADVLERTFDVLARRGYARTLAWLYLSRRDDEPDEDSIGHGDQLRRIADAVHAIRSERHGGAPPPYQDTLFTVALASFALFGHATAGPTIRASAGIDDRRFLRWLTHLLVEHLGAGARALD